MITTPINNYEDLVRERKRLKKEIAHYELRLKDNIVSLEQSLRPANIAVEFAHKMTEPSQQGIITHGVKNIVGGLASSVFSSYSWPVRFALTQVSKNMASKYINNQAPTIVSFLTKWLKKKTEKKELTSRTTNLPGTVNVA